MNLISVLKQIEQQPRTNEKIKILQDNRSDELIDFLNYVYNNHIVFGIKASSIPKIVSGFDDEIPLKMFEELSNISGRLNKINCIKRHLGGHKKAVIKWCLLAIDRDLNINLAKKLINKAFGEQTIPDFKIMLAWKCSEKRYLNNFSDLDWAYYNVKIDGIRCICTVNSITDITFITRSGLPIQEFLTVNIKKDIQANIEHLQGKVLDGEIYSSHFQKLMRIVSRKHVNMDSVLIRESTRYKIFDIISDSHLQLVDRVENLKKIDEQLKGIFLQTIKYFKVRNDFALIDKIARKYIDRGAEGIILKHPFKQYEYKRSNYWLKFKNKDTIDLKCIGYYNGKAGTDIEHMLGGIILDYDGIKLSCGSGFSENERQTYWDNRSELIGQMVEISYMEKTKTGSIRHPVFERFRRDK